MGQRYVVNRFTYSGTADGGAADVLHRRREPLRIYKWQRGRALERFSALGSEDDLLLSRRQGVNYVLP